MDKVLIFPRKKLLASILLLRFIDFARFALPLDSPIM